MLQTKTLTTVSHCSRSENQAGALARSSHQLISCMDRPYDRPDRKWTVCLTICPFGKLSKAARPSRGRTAGYALQEPLLLQRVQVAADGHPRCRAGPPALSTKSGRRDSRRIEECVSRALVDRVRADDGLGHAGAAGVGGGCSQ